MQLLDRASGMMLARTPPERRIFRDGWGSDHILDWYASIVAVPPKIRQIDPILSDPTEVEDLVETDLTFASPAEHLPDASRLARARMISPRDGARRVCVLMAAWNEHGYGARSKLARMMASEGIASVILENPFYGERRNDPADQRPLASVADFAVMGRAAVVEGMTLLSHFQAEGSSTGVAGYSMGGNIAAFVGGLTTFPTAIAAAAASHSPAPPFLQGVMRNSIAWDALGGDNPEVRQRLGDFFRSASVLDHEPPPHAAAAVLTAATIDGFVPTSAVLALHRHWRGSEMAWVRAGHATLLWRHKDRMAEGIVRAFERVEAMTPRTH